MRLLLRSRGRKGKKKKKTQQWLLNYDGRRAYGVDEQWLTQSLLGKDITTDLA